MPSSGRRSMLVAILLVLSEASNAYIRPGRMQYISHVGHDRATRGQAMASAERQENDGTIYTRAMDRGDVLQSWAGTGLALLLGGRVASSSAARAHAATDTGTGAPVGGPGSLMPPRPGGMGIEGRGAGERGNVRDIPTRREKSRPALVEALVYLPNGVGYWGELIDKEYEGGEETLFLTCSCREKVVLAARVPMSALVFPFLAQFYEGNIVARESAWQACQNQDLVVRARVCTTAGLPVCRAPLLTAASYSKVIPELLDPQSQKLLGKNVRLGASLMLQRAGEPTLKDRLDRGELQDISAMGGKGTPAYQLLSSPEDR